MLRVHRIVLSLGGTLGSDSFTPSAETPRLELGGGGAEIQFHLQQTILVLKLQGQDNPGLQEDQAPSAG